LAYSAIWGISIALYSDLALHFAIFQLLYLPEVHLALRISAKSEGRFSTLSNAPIQKWKQKIIPCGLGVSCNQIQHNICHWDFTPTHVRTNALVLLGPTFLHSLGANHNSGYPLEMRPKKYNVDMLALQIRYILI